MSWTGFSLLSLICVTGVLTMKVHRESARVTVKEGITHFPIKNSNQSFVKLISTKGSKIIWVGINEKLYYINLAQQDSTLKPVNVNLCEGEINHSDNSKCPYRISLLAEGGDRHLLFLCAAIEKTKCCYLNFNYSLTHCFHLENYHPKIYEPSLLVDDMLYFTLSERGLYRINHDHNHNIWPSPSLETEQKYLKLVAGKDRQKGKMYSFFAEKHKSIDGEPDHWIPRVSQNCMNDRGGPKGTLQNNWVSMIYARLECGRKKDDFTQLIDVATIETNYDTKIYALFRNYWNMSAVCVYNMTEIGTIFTSSEFNINKAPPSFRPGTCVENSMHLQNEVLAFIKERPEMKDAVKPENGPLIFRHHHYNHIQVDRIHSSTVLLLSLAHGGVHKVLEQSVDQPVFVIAEYLPSLQGSDITSMLLHNSEKRLYVSSSNELVQIDLAMCKVYGNECANCQLSQDPYCRWNNSHCTTAEKPAQDTQNCDMPFAEPSKTINGEEKSVVLVMPSSKHYLVCPMTSHHATYHWYHGQTREECALSDQDCLYLIASMNKTHEGSYRCESSENGEQRIVVQYDLSMSHSDTLIPVLFPYCLLLLTAFHIFL